MHNTDDLERAGKRPEHRVVIDRFNRAWEADRGNREDALSDLKFLAGDQWPSDIRAAREAQGRPIITVNRLPQFVRQVTGDMRQSRPAIKVSPVDDEGDPKIATIYNGIVRHIERISKADMVYTMAFQGAVSCGIGHFRITTEYCRDSVTEQDIKIRAIQNPIGVFWDPDAKEVDRSDAQYCFVVDGMTSEAFKERWPKAAISPIGATDGQDSSSLFWQDGDRVRVAEYWYKVPKKRRLVVMVDGSTRDLTDVPKDALPFLEAQIQRGEDGRLLERQVDGHEVLMCIVSGSQVLEGPYRFPVPMIPVVPVVGEETVIGDRVVRTSLIRHAKDPQRLYNYWRSSAAEMIALAPKAPYLVTAAMIQRHRAMWDRASTSPLPYLLYDPDAQATGSAGRPVREMPPPPPQALWKEAEIAAEDMKGTTGIYDAGLGARSNETSGRAILARQKEGDTATYHFFDNLAHAIRRAGEIIVALIPKIYDTERVVRLMNEDGSEDWARVNQISYEADGQRKIINDLTVGKYDVTVSSGPSYTTQRVEAANAIVEFMRAYPPAAPAVADLLAEMMDWPKSDLIAGRLRLMLPPQVQMAFEALDKAGGDAGEVMQALQQQPQQPDPMAMLSAEKMAAEAQKTKAQAESVALDNQMKAGAMGLPPMPPQPAQG
jgi:hypothetical protein